MSDLPRKQLWAYCDPWSVRPGEAVHLHVSSGEDRTYVLDVVRLAGPAADNGSPEVVDVDAAGSYPGAHRPLPSGSYAETDAVAWPLQDGGVVAFAVMATTPDLGREQCLVSLRDGDSGLWIGLDAAGRAVLRLGDGATTAELVADLPLRERRWHRIRAAWSASDGTATLRVERLDTGAVAQDTAQAAFAAPAAATLLVGAARDGDGPMQAHFNGRIGGLSVSDVAGATLAAWDLSADPASATVAGTGAHAVDLRLVNAPTRSVPGPLWDGTAHDPQLAPSHYDAVHFHEDDLEDARWPVDARITVPPDAPSGIYAARLRTDVEETVVPFFVRSREGATPAVTFLASTATYLAYANIRMWTGSPLAEMAAIQPTGMVDEIFATIAQHAEIAPSLYDHHRDGSPCMIVTRRRPLLSMTPNSPAVWSVKADLDIIAWLASTGLDVDVTTEEDLHREGRAALAGRCVVTGSHPEYWSTRMWDAAQAFLDDGGRLMYLGGNGFYWRVSHPDDRPWLMECRRAETGARFTETEPGAYFHQFGGELGGLWRRIGRTPQSLVGVGMAGNGFDDGTPYHFTEHAGDARAAFVLDGIDIARPFGAHGAFGLGGGAAGSEIDRADRGLGTPDHALILASSGPHSTNYYQAPEETLQIHYGLSGPGAPSLRADIVFFETASGGAVFSVGSIAWAQSLATDGYANDVARMSTNVLRRFADAQPFALPG